MQWLAHRCIKIEIRYSFIWFHTNTNVHYKLKISLNNIFQQADNIGQDTSLQTLVVPLAE